MDPKRIVNHATLRHLSHFRCLFEKMSCTHTAPFIRHSCPPFGYHSYVRPRQHISERTSSEWASAPTQHVRYHPNHVSWSKDEGIESFPVLATARTIILPRAVGLLSGPGQIKILLQYRTRERDSTVGEYTVKRSLALFFEIAVLGVSRMHTAHPIE